MPIRVFQENLVIVEGQVRLNENSANHVVRVLRQQVGDALVMFDGTGVEYHGEIATINKKHVSVTILQQQAINRESPLQIHLFQGLSKGERMDWVMQKAVELGVTSITPLITQHCAVKVSTERLDKKIEHWQRIAISACEQCGRNLVPQVQPPVDFAAVFDDLSIKKLLLHPSANNQWQQMQLATSELQLLIGPEGGFSSAEVEQAIARDCNIVSLGPRILRTETAAIAALTAVQMWWGDLMG